MNRGIITLVEQFHVSDETIDRFVRSIEKFKKQQADIEHIRQRSEPQHNNHQKESRRTIAYKNRMIGNRHFLKKEYDEAERHFQLVLDYCETNSGKAPDLCCMAMNDMGGLKLGVVQSDEGISYFKSALSLAEQYFPYGHPITAKTLINIGHYYSSIADYKNALEYYEKALAVIKKIYNEDPPEVLQIYFALGRLYLMEDNIVKGEDYTKKAMVGIEKAFGPDGGLYARCLLNLGFLQHRKKEYDQAEQSYNKAIEIWNNSEGLTAYPQAITLTLLARLYTEKGNVEKAASSLLKCHQLENEALGQITDFTTESQQLKRAAGDIVTMQKYLYFIGRYYKNDQPKIQEAFNTWINGKGRIFDVQARLHESSAEGDNPESVALYQELSKVRRELSKLAFANNSNVEGNEHRITELETRKDMLEIQLSRMGKSVSSNRVMEDADSQTISKMLPPGSVLLEFARTQAMRINKDAEEIDSYIAFIVHAGTENDIGMVKLGDADKIDSLIADYKKGLSSSEKNNGKTASAISKELYGLVFHPLVEHLGTSKDVFISPDGNLSLLPFEVLQKPDGSFLIEKYTFNYVAAGRDLTGFANDQVLGGRSLFMGAPDFQLAKPLNSNDKMAMLSIRSSDLGELSFVNLPYAKDELKSIRNVMGAAQSDLYIGKDALEETLLNASHPAIIHLATHGFFLSDQELPGAGRGFQMAALPTTEGQSHSQIKGKIDIENPLLRSGILLSGAQHSLTNGSNGSHDGIVTAEEILGMNLHGTEMVVLSACDTGLGDVKSGEGVFGLRRAFTQAGAKSLVMSLWKVPDQETKELMVQFYRNIKSGKMSRCQALRQAILKEKEIVMKRYGHDNPRYWGAFVFMGQP